MAIEPDTDMATMPIPELVEALRTKIPKENFLLSLTMGIIAGRMMKEYERANQCEKDAALLAQKLSAGITELEEKIDNCEYQRCPCR